ncbi:MAG: SDR family oxidoreductase [Candidatus Omnitrophota bacterium]
MINLKGRVALVTGSSRGIGSACAVRLAEAGADVVINYVTSRSAAEAVAEQVRARGRRTAIVKADISEEEDVMSMIDFIKNTFGALDIVISNAASGGFRPLLATTARNFEAAMNTNVRALLFLIQAALPMLERSPNRAKVIALSSPGSVRSLPMYGLIGSTKAALESMIRHFALEIGNRGVNLNVVQAGLVETDSIRQIPNFKEFVSSQGTKNMVKGRRLTVEDVADAVLYLASPLSDMIQGQTLVIDGGASIGI